MAKFEIGDLVVLKSGSMRMVVEEIAGEDVVQTLWCNEGVIGRDSFKTVLLNKWEQREDAPRGRPHGGGNRDGGKPPFRGGDRDGGKPSFRGGDRDGGKPSFRGGDRDGGGAPRKTGWDGKPREKKFYRKDD